MQRPPRDPKTPLLPYPVLLRTGLVTLMMLAGALWLFSWEMGRSHATLAAARTAVVNVIVLVEIVYLFNCRSLTQPCFSRGFFSNRWVFAGAFAMLAAQLVFTYAPVMNRLFHSAPLDGASWLRIGGVALAVVTVVEVEKWLRFGRGRGAHAVPT